MKNKKILPNILGDKKWNISFYTAIILTVLVAIGLVGVVGISLAQLGLLISVSVGIVLVATLLINYIVAYLNNSSITIKENFFGALLIAIFVPIILGIAGVVGTISVGMISVITLFVSILILNYVGFFVAKKIKL